MTNSEDRPGQVITFYSYKGGTGRSMALANLAILLANRQTESGGKPVLMIDWDLEAPGLHRYFQNYLAVSHRQLNGLIELFEDARSRVRPGCAPDEEEAMTQGVVNALDLKRYAEPTTLSKLSLMYAGRFDEGYSSRTNSFPWEAFFRDAPSFFRLFAEKLSNDFSYVLIDSRTGQTDISGICTTLMPEKLVVVFTPNRQSLTGIVDLVTNAHQYRRASDDVRPLVVYPLPSRIETSVQPIAQKWRLGDESEGIEGWQGQFHALFRKVYELGPKLSLEKYFDEVQIQHVAPYAFGEPLPVLLEKRGSDRLTLTKSYNTFCEYLLKDAPWSDEGVAVVQDAEVQKRIERLNEAARLQAAQGSLWSRAMEWLRIHPLIAIVTIGFLALATGWLIGRAIANRSSLRLVATVLRDAQQNDSEVTALLLTHALEGLTGDDRALALRELRSTLGRLPQPLRTIRLASEVENVYFSRKIDKLLIRSAAGEVGVFDVSDQQLTWLPDRYAIAAFADDSGRVVAIGRDPRSPTWPQPFQVSTWFGSTLESTVPWHEFDYVRIAGPYALEYASSVFKIIPLTSSFTMAVGEFSNFPDTAASDSGKTVALIGDSKVMLCWTAARICDQVRSDFQPRAVAVSRDGEWFAFSQPRRIVLWKLHGRPSEIKNVEGQADQLVFSPSGASLAALSPDGVTFYTVPELAVTGTDTRKNSTSGPLGIDWPEDDKLLVVYSDWIEVHPLQSPDEPLISAPIRGSGTRTASARENVLAVGSGRDVVLYDTRALPAIESMPIDELRRVVCTRTGRDLTPGEWTTYFSDRPYERSCELSALATGRE